MICPLVYSPGLLSTCSVVWIVYTVYSGHTVQYSRHRSMPFTLSSGDCTRQSALYYPPPHQQKQQSQCMPSACLVWPELSLFDFNANYHVHWDLTHNIVSVFAFWPIYVIRLNSILTPLPGWETKTMLHVCTETKTCIVQTKVTNNQFFRGVFLWYSGNSTLGSATSSTWSVTLVTLVKTLRVLYSTTPSLLQQFIADLSI